MKFVFFFSEKWFLLVRKKIRALVLAAGFSDILRFHSVEREQSIEKFIFNFLHKGITIERHFYY
jgi:hypothetical protein